MQLVEFLLLRPGKVAVIAEVAGKAVGVVLLQEQGQRIGTVAVDVLRLQDAGYALAVFVDLLGDLEDFLLQLVQGLLGLALLLLQLLQQARSLGHGGGAGLEGIAGFGAVGLFGTQVFFQRVDLLADFLQVLLDRCGRQRGFRRRESHGDRGEQEKAGKVFHSSSTRECPVMSSGAGRPISARRVGAMSLRAPPSRMRAGRCPT